MLLPVTCLPALHMGAGTWEQQGAFRRYCSSSGVGGGRVALWCSAGRQVTGMGTAAPRLLPPLSLPCRHTKRTAAYATSAAFRCVVRHATFCRIFASSCLLLVVRRSSLLSRCAWLWRSVSSLLRVVWLRCFVARCGVARGGCVRCSSVVVCRSEGRATAKRGRGASSRRRAKTRGGCGARFDATPPLFLMGPKLKPGGTLPACDGVDQHTSCAPTPPLNRRFGFRPPPNLATSKHHLTRPCPRDTMLMAARHWTPADNKETSL